MGDWAPPGPSAHKPKKPRTDKKKYVAVTSKGKKKELDCPKLVLINTNDLKIITLLGADIVCFESFYGSCSTKSSKAPTALKSSVFLIHLQLFWGCRRNMHGVQNSTIMRKQLGACLLKLACTCIHII